MTATDAELIEASLRVPVRGAGRVRVPAAGQLVADACIDVATSGPDLAVAVAMAVAVELPLAALCLRTAAFQ